MLLTCIQKSLFQGFICKIHLIAPIFCTEPVHIYLMKFSTYLHHAGVRIAGLLIIVAFFIPLNAKNRKRKRFPFYFAKAENA